MGKVIIKDNATGIKVSLDKLLGAMSSNGFKIGERKHVNDEFNEVTFDQCFIDKLRTLTITEQVFDETELLMLMSFMGRHNEYDNPLFSKLKDMIYEMRDTNVN